MADQLTENARNFLDRRSGDKTTTELDRLGSEERRKAVMGMSRTANIVWTLL